jgi:hypothetical protein
MSKPKTLYQTERDHLRQQMPYRWWHYAVVILALGIALTPLHPDFYPGNPYRIYSMMLGAVALYWWLQWRVLRSAVMLSRLALAVDAPEHLVGTVSQHGRAVAQVRAVFAHHRLFIAIIALIMTGVSIALLWYFFYFTTQHDVGSHNPFHQYENVSTTRYDRGMLKYIGSISSGYLYPSNRSFDVVKSYQFAFPRLLGVSFIVVANSFGTLSIGLYKSTYRRALRHLILTGFVMFVLFAGLYFFRETPFGSCYRSWWDPNGCGWKTNPARVIDSIAAIGLTGVDGGITLATGWFCPTQSRGMLPASGSCLRHMLIAIVFIDLQFGLGIYRIRGASELVAKRKAPASASTVT